MDNYNYPMGADASDAPWNQPEIPEIEVEVCVSVTLSKIMKVCVDDYDIEEGCLIPNVSENVLHNAVKNQVVLPHELSDVLKIKFKEIGIPPGLKDSIDDCSDWCVDDLEVILD